ncbi:hypothetical protein AVEN_177750-1 [Araneus ventricosus]|uniref:HTH CENPB-type domain-containing protein n=1 Tax=Araneus ventricosus TaxID=182803 RepID=A0A4Y2I8H4_ARAVE|nr:hypothetical protein AVEN_177750-1 [Araneus ventricosus]
MEIIKAKKKDNLLAKQIIKKFKIGKSQFYEIFKKKNEITELWSSGNGSIKRKMRQTVNEEINEIVWEWFVDARSRNLQISGPILQAQAKDIAEKLGKLIFMHQMDGLKVSEKHMGYLSKQSVVKLGTFSLKK